MKLSDLISNDRLFVVVKPNAKKTEVLSIDKETSSVRIALKAVPEDDKANKELIRFISKELGKKVLIEKGRKSKEKILKIV